MHWRPLSERIKRLPEYFTPQEWTIIGGAALLLTLVIILVSITRPEVDYRTFSEMDPIRSRDALRVAVLEDVPRFASVSEEKEREGLEIELAHMLAEYILGDQSKVDFVPCSLTSRAARLRLDYADCVIALYQQGSSSSFVFSEPYYTDAVGLLVSADGEISALSQLQGHTVGVLSGQFDRSGYTARRGAFDVLNDYNKNSHSNLEVKTYTSVPDMLEDLRAGRIAAAAMENALIEKYYDASLAVLGEGIGTISYSVALRAGNEPLLQLVNELIRQAREDGRLDSLCEKWGLTDYSGS